MIFSKFLQNFFRVFPFSYQICHLIYVHISFRFVFDKNGNNVFK